MTTTTRDPRQSASYASAVTALGTLATHPAVLKHIDTEHPSFLDARDEAFWSSGEHVQLEAAVALYHGMSGPTIRELVGRCDRDVLSAILTGLGQSSTEFRAGVLRAAEALS